jgi:hypothetical protein
MESGAKLTQVLWDLAQGLPSLITILVCIVVIITRRQRHPRVSLLALIGLSLIFIHNVIFTFVYVWVPSLFINSTYTSQDIQNLYLVLGLIFNSTRVIAFAPLLAAIFVSRPRAVKQDAEGLVRA